MLRRKRILAASHPCKNAYRKQPLALPSFVSPSLRQIYRQRLSSNQFADCRRAVGLVELYFCLFEYAFPARQLFPDEGCELVRRAADRADAYLLKPADDARVIVHS